MSEELWEERAHYGDLRSVLDPADVSGNKNAYIDLVQKIALGRHFPIARNHAVMDFGCGIGRFTEWLGARAGMVVGVELVPEMIITAHRLHPDPKYRWVRYAGGQLPFRDDSLDRILSVGVLQHVLDDGDLLRLVREFARTLKPGGKIALIEQVNAGQRKSVAGYIEQRKASEYLDVFGQGGFGVDLSRPIRASWRIASAILRRPGARVMLRPLAMATLLAARRLSRTSAYSDQLMVFTKPQSSS